MYFQSTWAQLLEHVICSFAAEFRVFSELERNNGTLTAVSTCKPSSSLFKIPRVVETNPNATQFYHKLFS